MRSNEYERGDILKVSVVIPTFNRPKQVLASLYALRWQTMPADQFEVIAVNDGSHVSYADIETEETPFRFTLLEQENQGAAVARNTGAAYGQGDVLLFLDDDIRLRRNTLQQLYDRCIALDNTIVLGALVTPNSLLTSPYAQINHKHVDHEVVTSEAALRPVSYTHTMTKIMMIPRMLFETSGGFQDPAGGRLYWDDVDFGYRAHRAGVRIMRCHSAVAEHWDDGLADWQTAARRAERASELAIKLFERHPALERQLLMFEDKRPIQLGEDLPGLMARKVARRVMAFRPIQSTLEWVTNSAEKRFPNPYLLEPLYRWIIGGYIYKGYQTALREAAR